MTSKTLTIVATAASVYVAVTVVAITIHLFNQYPETSPIEAVVSMLLWIPFATASPVVAFRTIQAHVPVRS